MQILDMLEYYNKQLYYTFIFNISFGVTFFDYISSFCRIMFLVSVYSL